MIISPLIQCVLVLALASRAIAQVGTIPWTPKSDRILRQVEITVPPKYAAIALDKALHFVRVPDGWTASVFAAGSALNKPRFMSWGPKSTLFVANMNGNNILALPDENRDGVADTVIVAARGFSLGHDVRFWRDTMFVCQEAGVIKLWRSDTSSYVYDQRLTVIDKGSQANQTGGNHRTRTLVIDTIRMKLYVSVGSRGNADRESDRAVLEEYNYDGSGRRVFASGTRNAVGMTLHPRTGRLWASNNGSDNQGNNLPPEWVDIIREGGFYGYPVGYHFRNWFPLTGDYQDLKPFTKQDSANMERMQPPAALVDAHCAPMGLVFTEDGVRSEYANGAFMAMRGSWNRTPPSGAKIVFLRFDNDADTIANEVEDFCTGFIRDTSNAATRWARPVGVAVDNSGCVYVSIDDGKQCVLRLTPPTPSHVHDVQQTGTFVRPNPARDMVAIDVQPSEPCQVVVVDAQGKVWADESVSFGKTRLHVDSSTWPNGSYIVVMRSSSGLRTQNVTIYR